MKMKECPSCGLDVESNSKECMYCHYEFPGFSIGYKVVALVLALFFLWLILF